MDPTSSINWMPFGASVGERLQPEKSILLKHLKTKSKEVLALFKPSPQLDDAFKNKVLSPTAQHHLEQLKLGKAVAVITGQQPCLWGGPALVMHKLMTTISICKWLKSEGLEAVPLFWNASEDHDLHEMLQVAGYYPDLGLQKHKLKIQKLFSAETLQSLAPETLPKSLSPWIASLWQLHQQNWAEQISGVLMDLFAADGLLALEPRHLAPNSIDFWKRVETHQNQLIEAYNFDEEQLILSGSRLQAPRRHPLPIFKLSTNGERLSLGQLGQTRFNLDNFWTPDSRPSTGALLRPLFAQAHLPIVCSVLGPAEMQYHRQLPSAFKALNLPKPYLWPRLGGTYVPQKLSQELSVQGVSVADLLSHKIKLKDFLSLEAENSLERQMFGQHLNAIYREQIQKFPQASLSLDRFEKDLFKAFHRFERGLQNEDLRARGFSPKRLHQLQEWLLPKGGPQERQLGWSFILKNPEHFQSIAKQFADPFDFSHRIYE
jgi:bacillithiol synthase